ncbi:unnamed protein product [Triticum turgidum subsp. durum]|uniref:Uncharacterized protein n=1 Tax=Triticum turgidum subsp. durum TaxID=4567 RepID=A0A9R0XNX9_TRITD|nr:unnamed protein product [Triticum turgidum subsp. durum]
MPPQFPAGSARPSSASAAPAGGVKRPSLPPTTSLSPPPTKKIARPASAPCLPALSKKVPPRPVPSTAPRPRPPQPPPSASSAARAAGPPKKTAQRPAAEAEAAPGRAAESVHPARRLACGTAVYVRTRYYVVIADGTGRCCLLIWLPARVVSSSDAYHCSVKYAADLHAMFAGKIVRVPVTDVRVAPSHRPSAAPAAAKAAQSQRPQQQAP